MSTVGPIEYKNSDVIKLSKEQLITLRDDYRSSEKRVEGGVLIATLAVGSLTGPFGVAFGIATGALSYYASDKYQTLDNQIQDILDYNNCENGIYIMFTYYEKNFYNPDGSIYHTKRVIERIKPVYHA